MKLLLSVLLLLMASAASAQQCIQLNGVSGTGTWTTIPCPTPTPTPLSSPTPVPTPAGSYEAQPQAIFFDAQRNTGFGTTSPIFNDDGVTGENVGKYFAIDAGKPEASAYLGLGGSRTGLNARSGVLNFYNLAMGGVDHRTAIIEGRNDGALGRGRLGFYTSPSNVGPVERLTIAWDGSTRIGNPNVGGGTLSVIGLLGQTLIQSWYDSNGLPIAQVLADGRLVLTKIGKGIVLHSPNNLCWETTVGDTGVLGTKAVTCP